MIFITSGIVRIKRKIVTGSRTKLSNEMQLYTIPGSKITDQAAACRLKKQSKGVYSFMFPIP
jgi:hypothetical protein